jgi:hypothetical protein
MVALDLPGLWLGPELLDDSIYPWSSNLLIRLAKFAGMGRSKHVHRDASQYASCEGSRLRAARADGSGVLGLAEITAPDRHGCTLPPPKED